MNRPVVAVGQHTPRLLTLADTGRAAVVDALAAFDALPADQRDSPASYAHRRVVADALAACGYPVSTGVAVRAAREFLALPNRGSP